MNKLISIFFLFPLLVMAQYEPPVGQFGTTAIHKDSSVIMGWASSIITFKRGAADIANGWASLASFGDSTEALGYAQGNSTNVVSLGDSGYVTLGFQFPIQNGPGFDFAVFENSFSDDYLEFAFVEVSSDGVNFVRFPSVSVTQVISQTGPFTYSNTEQVHNLAGKYRQGYGTPFDLEELVDSSGLNLDSIRFVRIVDVIGSIDPNFGSVDAWGNLINDPYPTDFAAGGFDLDGVAVIHENNIYANQADFDVQFTLYPNPSSGSFCVKTNFAYESLLIYNIQGTLILTSVRQESGNYNIQGALEPGVYLVKTNASDQCIRIIVI